MVADGLKYDNHVNEIDRPSIEKIEQVLVGNLQLFSMFHNLRASLYKYGIGMSPMVIYGPLARSPKAALKIMATTFAIEFVSVEKEEDHLKLGVLLKGQVKYHF